MQITLPTLLGATFITLKLCHIIAWSWLWVLAPFWLIPAILIGVVLFLVAIGASVGVTSALFGVRGRRAGRRRAF